MYRVCEKPLILEIMEAKEIGYFFETAFMFNYVHFNAQVVRDKRAFVAAITKYFILDRLPKDIVYIDEFGKYNFKQGSNIKKAIDDVLDTFIKVFGSVTGDVSVMATFAKFYGEEERSFDEEINMERDLEFSDFTRTLDRMLNYRDILS